MTINPEKFKDVKVLVIGDIMLDEYIIGEAHRISPEAPVPVILNPESKFVLGGAGNVLANVVSLGAQAQIFGVISDDRAGLNATKLIEKITGPAGPLGGLISTGGMPTTRKRRLIANGQQVARIDYECTDDIDLKAHQWTAKVLLSQIQWADLVIVSDYAKGLINDALMSLIESYCTRYETPFIVDPKGDDFSKYAGAEVITPNEKETEIAKDKFSTWDDFVDSIGDTAIVLTKGKYGIEVGSVDRRAPWIDIPAEAKAVSDVSGAGDTVIAALGVALASGYDLEESARFANRCAGIVVGKPGTAIVTTDDLKISLGVEF